MKSTETAPIKPFLSTNGVEIKHITHDTEGIDVSTRNTLARKALGRPALSPEQTSQLRDALRGESKFQGVGDYEAIRALHGTHSPEAQVAWRQYRDRASASKKLGVRNLEFDNESNTLVVDAINVPFPVYKTLSKPENSAEIREFAEATGTAATLVTADNKLIIQHRLASKPKPDGGFTRGNALYADIPGASAAGMLDAKPGDNPSIPARIDTNTVTANVLKEIDEELGLGHDDISGIKIVGVASDKIQPHDELLFYSATPLTMDQVYAKSKESNRNRALGDADFDEKFLAIDATPSAIKTLLTEVRTPMPSTHAASIFATGYSIVLEQQGPQAAEKWRMEVEDGMRENENAINEIIRLHYVENPESADDIPARYNGKSAPIRNLKGYSPEFTPEEQGLPTLDSELKRTSLAQD